MRRSDVWSVPIFVFGVWLTSANLWAQEPFLLPLGPGPEWRGPVVPVGANEVFATADGCAMCHSASHHATAMRTSLGDDVSPHELWQGSMMANSFRDPYWRAQVAKESALNPDKAEALQALCIRCHAPMAHHTARLGGQKSSTVTALVGNPLAEDGVSCTVCHQIQPHGLGDKSTFGGLIDIKQGRRIFGPHARPLAGPMRMHSSYTPTESDHIRKSGLCGSCHTLFTGHTGTEFPEQTPYLEWRNSVFQDESKPTDEARSCQSCHMPDLGPMRIARNPGGREFPLERRSPYGAHTFVGGNAFMLDLLRTHRDRLGVTAPDQALERAAAATRYQLRHDTASLAIGPITRKDGTLSFQVTTTNKTGHKFPTGYPSRRTWLRLQVRGGNGVVFECGDADAFGKIAFLSDELGLPHIKTISRPTDVVIYEMVAHDKEGRPTTTLSQMAKRIKDTRLLPKGWNAEAPGIGDIAPVGLDGDADFVAGSDTVDVRIPIDSDVDGTVQVTAWLYYQTIPPAWVEALRTVDAAEAVSFVQMYDGAVREPETIAIVTRGSR